jgi:hypothetical protein
VLLGLARSERAAGDLDAALDAAREAVARIELFHALSPLHHALFETASKPPGPPGKQQAPPPPLDPPGGWRYMPRNHLLSLTGIQQAVRSAEASALAEMASLAKADEWEALFQVLPIVEMLDLARRAFDPR